MMVVAHATSPIRFTTLRPTRSTSADFAIVAICRFGYGRLSGCGRSQIGPAEGCSWTGMEMVSLAETLISRSGWIWNSALRSRSSTLRW